MQVKDGLKDQQLVTNEAPNASDTLKTTKSEIVESTGIDSADENNFIIVPTVVTVTNVQLSELPLTFE